MCGWERTCQQGLEDCWDCRDLKQGTESNNPQGQSGHRMLLKTNGTVNSYTHSWTFYGCFCTVTQWSHCNRDVFRSTEFNTYYYLILSMSFSFPVTKTQSWLTQPKMERFNCSWLRAFSLSESGSKAEPSRQKGQERRAAQCTAAGMRSRISAGRRGLKSRSPSSMARPDIPGTCLSHLLAFCQTKEADKSGLSVTLDKAW